MATRKEALVFKDLTIDYGFRIWCDLSSSDLIKIEGVSHVSKQPEGYFCVYLDRRYSLSDIKKEICEMSGYELRQWGYIRKKETIFRKELKKNMYVDLHLHDWRAEANNDAGYTGPVRPGHGNEYAEIVTCQCEEPWIHSDSGEIEDWMKGDKIE